MKLGSVAFFKRLIVFFVLLLIAGLTAATVFLAFLNSDKSNVIEQLVSDKSALQALHNLDGARSAPDIDDIIAILDGIGIDYTALVNAIYEGHSGAFDGVREFLQPEVGDESESPSSGDISDNGDNGDTPENNPSSHETEPFVLPEPELTEEPEPAIEPEPEPTANPYTELYPHLYSGFTPPAAYMDDSNYIYLTFDDGPTTGITDNILRYLNRHDAKATFFVMPSDTENGKNFLNQMLDNGHEIAVHSMTHEYELIYASVENFLEDFNQAFNLIYEQTGYKPYLYRFPGGSINDFNANVRTDIIAEMNRRGFIYFDWNVDSRDALGANWSQMWSSVLEDIENLNRAVVLFHDRPGGNNTYLVIEDIIKELIAKGYTLSAITPETRPMQF
ncbi:MAG: polysaccharide deacetylase [Oscillospiraceae bacterium]|nr:polysaccharide deacetylase [Oscillospiraceae bacterium]